MQRAIHLSSSTVPRTIAFLLGFLLLSSGVSFSNRTVSGTNSFLCLSEISSGFKPFLTLLPYLIIILIFPTLENLKVFDAILPIIGWIVTFYFLFKVKHNKIWILLGVLFSILILPFALGNYEIRKSNIK